MVNILTSMAESRWCDFPIAAPHILKFDSNHCAHPQCHWARGQGHGLQTVLIYWDHSHFSTLAVTTVSYAVHSLKHSNVEAAFHVSFYMHTWHLQLVDVDICDEMHSARQLELPWATSPTSTIACWLTQVFYFCFAFGEMWLKLQRFRESWALARRSEGMAPFQRRDSTWARSTVRRISEATEKRSICVLCCTIFEWLQAVMPSWLGIGVAIAGVSFHRPGLIVVGSIWTGLLLLTTVLTLPWGEVPTVGSSWITRYFPRPEILQEWGENWCNLGLQAQVRQRYHAALMLALCAVIFGAFRTWACGPI